jgi:hypothetical protein
MIHKIKVVTSLFVLAAGIAYAEPQLSTQLSHAELQKMVQEARTTQQYQALATYFRSQQQTMRQKAKAEIPDWALRIQITTGIAQKYPRPVDSSRNRYEYFTYEAGKMGRQAAHYESLSAGAPQSAVQ